MAENGSNPFESGRVNLRDTAKWMLSGIIGVAALIVGTSTISQLGTLELESPRLWCAVVALLVAAGLCWVPFEKAVAVLRSDVQSLHQYAEATCGEYKEAADEVAKHFGTSLPEGKNLREFVNDYAKVRERTWNAAQSNADAEKAVAYIDGLYKTCRDACVAELVAVRFERLVQAIKFPGSVILLSFLLFSWAANPPKDAEKIFDKPYLEMLNGDDIAALKTAKLAGACYGPAAQLIVIAAPEAGPQTAILSGPGCPPHRITLSNGRIVVVN
jgi:hypothetical protein